MWRSGYADFDSHDKELSSIAHCSDDALPILRRLIDEKTLSKVLVETIELNRNSAITLLRRLLCFIGGFLKVNLNGTPSDKLICAVLASAGFYLRIVPISKLLGAGFSIFQKHIYLSLTENLLVVSALLHNSSPVVQRHFLDSMRCFPSFIAETSMDDVDCMKATTETLARIAFNDPHGLLEFTKNDTIGAVIQYANIEHLSSGTIALCSITELMRRYLESELVAASIFTAFFPLLLGVQDTKRNMPLPSMSAQTVRQSDLMAEFLAHLFRDIHSKVNLSCYIQQLIDRAPEKIDYRDRAVKVSVHLVHALPSNQQEDIIDWAIRYGVSSRVGSRAIAIDFLHGMRSLITREAPLNMVIKHMLARTKDNSSIVRKCALNNLNDCVSCLSKLKIEQKLQDSSKTITFTLSLL